jgi:peptidoglycan hydrolase CwlO-like protein
MGKAKEGEEGSINERNERLKKLRDRKIEDQREHGTLGELGVPTEPKDVVAKLHKGETVATPEQLRNLMSGSATNAISELMKSANVKTSTAGKSNNDGIDISKITSGLKEVTTTISSVSGGGSTTRSRVENDDAKSAKAEMESVKAKFENEKNEIRAQIKNNLGPESKPMDVVRAMRTDPRANAVETRMQEAMSKLSDRVNAGTSIKTTTEPAVGKIPSMDQFDSSNLTSKRAELKSQSEIKEQETDVEMANQEFETGEQSDKTSLKDLNEQLIQLNTSIRQLIDHSADTVETANKQVKATKRLSGNRFG